MASALSVSGGQIVHNHRTGSGQPAAYGGPPAGMSRPAVFLDRDGTLIEDVGYVDQLDRLQLYPWSLESVRLLRRSGYAVVVVTNQAGVARGFVREQMVTDVFELIQQRLAAIDERLDGHYYCPHLIDAPIESYRRQCSCHKPLPGMVEQAVAALDLDVSRSCVVGDRWTDIQLARSVGAKAVLVKTGYGVTQLADAPPGETADAVLENLLEAVGWVLSQPVMPS